MTRKERSHGYEKNELDRILSNHGSLYTSVFSAENEQGRAYPICPAEISGDVGTLETEKD
jgi:hypothetical protein